MARNKPQWKKDRSNKLADKFSDDCYRYEPATFKQLRALSFMVERAGKRYGVTLDPNIPLSKHDVAGLFRIFKDPQPRGTKVDTAMRFKRLSDLLERADCPYSWKFTNSFGDLEQIEPADHPLYKSPADLERERIHRHHEYVLTDLADEWDIEDERAEHETAVDEFLTGDDDYQWTDDDVLNEIELLDEELAGIECPYEQTAMADRIACLSAQIGG